MHEVSVMSTALEPATEAVRELERRTIDLTAKAGLGKVDFATVEEAVKALPVGAPPPRIFELKLETKASSELRR